MNAWQSLEEKPPLDHIRIGGVEVRSGSRVRLWPQKRADILDLSLKGMTATVECIEQDYENRIYIAVSIDDDPGKELGHLRQPGHRFFFRPEEVEPLASNHQGNG